MYREKYAYRKFFVATGSTQFRVFWIPINAIIFQLAARLLSQNTHPLNFTKFCQLMTLYSQTGSTILKPEVTDSDHVDIYH